MDSSLTQPVAKIAPPNDSSRPQDWLDALTSGTCDQEDFFRAIAALLQSEPDAGWELLGLVDQYYRRGRLSAQTFNILKTHLQGLLVEGPPPASAPLAAPAPAAAPVTSTAVSASPDELDEDATPRLLAAGDLLRGRYLVRGLLGRGGMGTVYAAIDQFRLDGSSGDQKVALKVLHTEVIKRPRLFAELRREFQYLQSLSHPNIVRVHEFDRDGELAFFTMEQLSGSLLSTALGTHEGSCLHRPYVFAIIRDTGFAVAHAHTRGVVHGDLNPGNIFYTDNGEIRVLDFGASHQLHRGPWISEFDGQSQIAVATPAYASCQILERETADVRDDIYALACIAYQLLTGKLPFGDKTALKARSLRLKPARPDGLRQRQWNALRAGLHFERERRPAEMAAWLEQLDLRGAAPRLPPLVSLWTDRRRGGGQTPQWKTAAIAAMAAIALYWTFIHADYLASEGGVANARLKSWILKATAQPRPAAPLAALPAEAEAVEAPPTQRSSELPTVHAAMPTKVMSVTSGAVAPAILPAASPVFGHARLELATDTVEVAPDEPQATIVIRRKGSLRGDASFNWWTESGTAKPGRDFVPIKSQVAHLGPGESSLSLAVPVLQNPVPGASRSFYVVIDRAGEDATVGPRTLTMITIPGTAPANPDSQ